MGVEHPWLSQATLFCWSALDEGLPDDAHALAEVLVFLGTGAWGRRPDAGRPQVDPDPRPSGARRARLGATRGGSPGIFG